LDRSPLQLGTHAMNDAMQTDASARLLTHEAVCAERYSNLIATITSMSARIGRLESLVWVVAGAMIVGMAGLVVTLIQKVAHIP
jgi:hypothetical protein